MTHEAAHRPESICKPHSESNRPSLPHSIEGTLILVNRQELRPQLCRLLGKFVHRRGLFLNEPSKLCPFFDRRSELGFDF